MNNYSLFHIETQRPIKNYDDDDDRKRHHYLPKHTQQVPQGISYEYKDFLFYLIFANVKTTNSIPFYCLREQ